MTPGIDLTPQDAERLRQILDAYQAKNPERIKEFDLANPPTPPYRHKEYPLAMFNHDTGEEKTAKNRAEEVRLIGEGFGRESIPTEEAPMQLDLTDEEKDLIAAAEAARSTKAKGKPGRPPKTLAA